MRSGSHTRRTPISRKLLRTRSAFSCERARSMDATTIWSGETDARPQARARIFSAKVIGAASAHGILGLPYRFRQILVFHPPVFLQTYERRVLAETGNPLLLALENAGGRAMQRFEELAQGAVRHPDRRH